MAARHVLLGVAAGTVGTVALERTTAWFYRMQGERSRQREQSVREGFPMTVLARRALDPVPGEKASGQDTKKTSRLSSGLHWGLSLSGGMLYGLLYRRVPFLGRMAGAPYGLMFWLINDEILNTAFRLAPPPQKFPLITHLRGMVGHLAYGMTIAGVFQLLNARVERRRRPWYRRTDWVPLVGR